MRFWRGERALDAQRALPQPKSGKLRRRVHMAGLNVRRDQALEKVLLTAWSSFEPGAEHARNCCSTTSRSKVAREEHGNFRADSARQRAMSVTTSSGEARWPRSSIRNPFARRLPQAVDRRAGIRTPTAAEDHLRLYAGELPDNLSTWSAKMMEGINLASFLRQVELPGHSRLASHSRWSSPPCRTTILHRSRSSS